jgi:hypothetical protein
MLIRSNTPVAILLNPKALAAVWLLQLHQTWGRAWIKKTDMRIKESSGKFDREKAMRLLETRGVEAVRTKMTRPWRTSWRGRNSRLRKKSRKWSNQYDQSKEEAGYNDRMEREDREKARELIEKRDAIKKDGFDAEDTANRLRDVAETYDLDVRRKAAELKNLEAFGQDEANDIRAPALEAAKRSQSTNEEADFLASADSLRAMFKGASDKVVKNSAENSPESRRAPAMAPAGQ